MGWPDTPTLEDQMAADSFVGNKFFKSLTNAYNTRKDWKDPTTAPILVRMARNK